MDGDTGVVDQRPQSQRWKVLFNCFQRRSYLLRAGDVNCQHMHPEALQRLTPGAVSVQTRGEYREIQRLQRLGQLVAES